MPPIEWLQFEEGLYWVGHEGAEFSYDNEGPRHRVFVPPFSLASRLVTNADFLAFIEDGGYRRSELWLSLGWNTVNERGWECAALLGKAGREVVHHDTGRNDGTSP